MNIRSVCRRRLFSLFVHLRRHNFALASLLSAEVDLWRPAHISARSAFSLTLRAISHSWHIQQLFYEGVEEGIAIELCILLLLGISGDYSRPIAIVLGNNSDNITNDFFRKALKFDGGNVERGRELRQ